MESVQASTVVVVGPYVRGPFTLNDGTVYDTSPAAVPVASPEHAAELAHLVGLHFKAHGHPDDQEYDPETGLMVQRPFAYQAPEEFKGYKPHADNHRLKKG